LKRHFHGDHYDQLRYVENGEHLLESLGWSKVEGSEGVPAETYIKEVKEGTSEIVLTNAITTTGKAGVTFKVFEVEWILNPLEAAALKTKFWEKLIVLQSPPKPASLAS
jgi:hypothetical protein